MITSFALQKEHLALPVSPSDPRIPASQEKVEVEEALKHQAQGTATMQKKEAQVATLSPFPFFGRMHWCLDLQPRTCLEGLVFYCPTTSAGTAPRTPRRACCPYASVLVTLLGVSRS